MKIKFSKLLFLSLFITTASFVQAGSPPPLPAATPSAEWGVYLGGQASNGSQNGDAFSPSMFVPINVTPNDIVIIDLRGKLAEVDGGLSVGAGYRKKLSSEMTVGVNSYLDLVRTTGGNALSQGSLGLEFLSNFIDVAVNFYAPLNPMQDIRGSEVVPVAKIVGNEFYLVYSDPAQEQTQMGLDLIIAGRFPIVDKLWVKLTGGVAYYFGGEHYAPLFTAQVAAQLDLQLDLFGAPAQTYVGVSGGVNSSGQPDWKVYMGLTVRLGEGTTPKDDGKGGVLFSDNTSRTTNRQDSPRVATIKASDRMHEERAAAVLDGKEYIDVYQADGSVDLSSFIDTTTEDGLVILNGDAGIINITQGIHLKDGQYLLGEGRVIVIKGPEGRTALLLVGGSRAVINQTEDHHSNTFSVQQNNNNHGNNDAVFFLTNNTLDGINIIGGVGVVVNAESEAKLINLNIAAKTGVIGETGANITIENATIDATEGGFLQRNADRTGSLTIKKSTISGDGYGVSFFKGDSVSVEESTINGQMFVMKNEGTTTIVKVSLKDSVSIASKGDVTINNVSIGRNAVVVSDGNVHLDGLTIERDLFVSAQYLVELMNSSVNGQAVLMSELDSVILDTVDAAKNLIISGNEVHGIHLSVDGNLVVLSNNVVTFNDYNVLGSTCFDKVKDGLETDIDCGGGSCHKCSIGKTCNINSDCKSSNCVANSCQ